MARDGNHPTRTDDDDSSAPGASGPDGSLGSLGSLTGDGLLDAARLPGPTPDPPRSWDALDELVRRAHADPDAAALWIHLDRTKEGANGWLHGLEAGTPSGHGDGADPVLPPSTADALLADETRPRADDRADGVLVILRGVNLNAGAEPDDLLALRIWLDPRLAITLRQFPVRTVRELRLAARDGAAPATTGGLLVRLAEGLTVRLVPVVENLRDLLDDCEAVAAATGEIERVDPSDRGENLRAARLAAETRRQAITLRRYMAPQRDALLALASSCSPALREADRAALGELAQRTARFVDDLEELRDRAGVTQDELRAIRERAAQRTEYLLALVAAIFLPLGFVTGLLGINVGGIPGSENPWAFWVVCVLMALCAVSLVALFKRWRWL